MKNNLYLDLHVLQTLPPSCVNRDDTGSPKTAIYGGTMRARVSSQSWKRAIRLKFKDIFAENMIGYRTKNVKKMLFEEILKLEELDENEADKLASKVIEKAKIKADENKKDVLFFISHPQLKALAELAIKYKNAGEDKKNDKNFEKECEHALTRLPSVDMLLFGRMAANNVNLNYDAAAQVAHGISTHAVSNEYDYFTAVDDFNVSDNAGAGHLGTVEFNSSTMYRYATVNVRELIRDDFDKEDVAIAVRGFVNAFVYSMPTGKQNTFANRTLPFFVYIALREDQPINMSGAYEKAVKGSDEGYEKESAKALVEYAERVYENYAKAPEKSWIISLDDYKIANSDRIKMEEVLEIVEKEVLEYTAEGDA